MTVYHVCSVSQFERYQNSGMILAPVRAWENEFQAARFSRSTHRPIILRLKFPNDAPKCFGHFNQARELPYSFKLPSDLRRKDHRKTIKVAE